MSFIKLNGGLLSLAQDGCCEKTGTISGGNWRRLAVMNQALVCHGNLQLVLPLSNDRTKQRHLTFHVFSLVFTSSDNWKSRMFIPKNMFTSLFSVHNTISLSHHEQVCLIRLHFERYFSHTSGKFLNFGHILNSADTLKIRF